MQYNPEFVFYRPILTAEEKLELEDFSKSKKKFFVRSSSSKEDIEKVFGNVEYVDANIDGEFGFITEKISEATFAKKADELGTVISRIRIEG
jgi:homoserine dehydrogenase